MVYLKSSAINAFISMQNLKLMQLLSWLGWTIGVGGRAFRTIANTMLWIKFVITQKSHIYEFNRYLL